MLRLIDQFRGRGLYVGSVVVTRYTGQPAADAFQARLEGLGLKVYRHYPIEGYPHNIAKIVSDEGYGRNQFIETSRPLVVVTAPGPGSGKMATCLSQLYHEHKRATVAGYAKFETFPIWNLPLKHPVNLAYEAATADLDDVNMIDPFHLQAYGETTVNYNRDVEVFPVLAAMFEKITGSCPYQSPTDMGVNMVGNCIVDDEVCQEAANQEIIRRYYDALCDRRQGKGSDSAVYKLELLMQQAGITPEIRPVTARANALLNALKRLSGAGGHGVHLIAQSAIEPIQKVKVDYLGSANPRLHSDEVLIALASSANAEPKAARALEQLAALKGCQAHCSVILSPADTTTYKRLGLQLTCEPKYQTNKLYHR